MAKSKNLGQLLILAKMGTLFWGEKKGYQKFHDACSIPFLSVLHKNKALHHFHKRGQHLIARHIKGLD